MSKNVGEPERPQITILHMRVACWLKLHAHTHMHKTTRPGHPHARIKKYVILIAFPRQQWFRKRTSYVTLFVHCLSCCISPRIIVYDINTQHVSHNLYLVHTYKGYLRIDKTYNTIFFKTSVDCSRPVLTM